MKHTNVLNVVRIETQQVIIPSFGMVPTSIVLFVILFVCTIIFAVVFTMVYVYLQHTRDASGLKKLEETAHNILSNSTPTADQQMNMFNAMMTKQDILRKRHQQRFEEKSSLNAEIEKQLKTAKFPLDEDDDGNDEKVEEIIESQTESDSDSDSSEVLPKTKLTLTDAMKCKQDEIVQECEKLSMDLMAAKTDKRLKPLTALKDFFSQLETKLGEYGSNKLCLYTTQTLCSNVLFKTHVLTLLQEIKKDNKFEDEVLKANQELVETIVPFIWTSY